MIRKFNTCRNKKSKLEKRIAHLETVTMLTSKDLNRNNIKDFISDKELSEAKRLESICFELDEEISKRLGLPSHKFETLVSNTQVSIRNIDDEDLEDVVINITPSEDVISIVCRRNRAVLGKREVRYGSSPQVIAGKIGDLLRDL